MKQVKAFLKEEDAVGVVEIILILVVLVALVLIFRNQITSIVNKAFKAATEGTGDIIGD